MQQIAHYLNTPAAAVGIGAVLAAVITAGLVFELFGSAFRGRKMRIGFALVNFVVGAAISIGVYRYFDNVGYGVVTALVAAFVLYNSRQYLERRYPRYR